jgi:hypothetical protein
MQDLQPRDADDFVAMHSNRETECIPSQIGWLQLKVKALFHYRPAQSFSRNRFGGGLFV